MTQSPGNWSKAKTMLFAAEKYIRFEKQLLACYWVLERLTLGDEANIYPEVIIF